MKYLASTPLTRRFLATAAQALPLGTQQLQCDLEALLVGKVLLPTPSGRQMFHETLGTGSESSWYRHCAALGDSLGPHYPRVVQAFQKRAAFAFKSGGVVIVDDHLAPHVGKHIEGAGIHHSSCAGGKDFGISWVYAHYWDPSVEYVLDFRAYQKKDNLKAKGREGDFKTKHELARAMVANLKVNPTTRPPLLFDNWYFAKDHVAAYMGDGWKFVSRPKTTNKCTVQNRRYTMAELYEAIPRDEFRPARVRNPKTGHVTPYYTAVRDAYFGKLGTLRLVFVDGDRPPAGDPDPEHAEAHATPGGRKFRVFVTNLTAWPATKILSTYALRWTIETNFRDENQVLGLHEAKWRTLKGQTCSVALTCLAQLFLAWAKQREALTGFGRKLETLGDLRHGFENYCQWRLIKLVGRNRAKRGKRVSFERLKQALFLGKGLEGVLAALET